MSADVTTWRTCSSCKGDIGFDELYYVCSISTCNRKESDFRFCSVECWDEHVPVMRHREAFAEERRSPSRAAWEREQAEADPPPSAPPSKTPESSAPSADPLREEDLPREILVVASKLKQYVRVRSGMNTSDAVAGVLSDRLRRLCDEGIRRAAAAGRKTLMDRDFED